MAGEKQRAYQIESRRKLEHVLGKNKPPLDWTISELYIACDKAKGRRIYAKEEA